MIYINKTRLTFIAVVTAYAAGAIGVICYGNGQQLQYESGPIVQCKDLTTAPSGAVQIDQCWYIYCNTATNCSSGPKYQANKRFREVWLKADTSPYLFMKNSPSDVPYGCCDCGPNYEQVSEPPGEG